MTAVQLSEITSILNLGRIVQLPQPIAGTAHSLSNILSSAGGDLTPMTTLRVSREYTYKIVTMVRIYVSSCGPGFLRSYTVELQAAN